MVTSDRVFRSRVADFLSDLAFPAGKADIIACAKRHNTASDVLATLLQLPDRKYLSLSDVRAAVALPAPS